MNIQECYSLMGGDYDGVHHRLEKDDRILRFLSRFPDEGSYASLNMALTAGNAEDAFRAAHSLKGICMNLGLTVLFNSVDTLTEELRAGTVTSAAAPMFDRVTQDYQSAVRNIRELLKS